MSYTAQGLDVSDITSAISKGVSFVENTAAPAVRAASYVLEDPALPQVAGILINLHGIEVTRSGPAAKGVGLSGLVTPLAVYAETRKNPLLVPLAVGLIIGLPFFLGYALGGSRSRRSR